MSTPIFAPYSQTYSTREPYITAAEFKNGATGVNTSKLVPTGSSDENADALLDLIADASSWADDLCDQILAATTEVEAGIFPVLNGTLRIPVSQTPIVAIYGLSVGNGTADLKPITDLEGLMITRKVVTFPAGGLGLDDEDAYAELTYIAGFANCLTAVDSAEGDSVLTLDNVLGIAPGMVLKIGDPGRNETITVLSLAGNVVTLVGPLQYLHGVGVSVSALPPVIKRAVILLTSALIKNRGSQSITIQTTQQTPREKIVAGGSGSRDFIQAEGMLRNFGRVI
jgi:hypothetical protein